MNFLKIAYRLVKIYWKIFKPTTLGAHCLVIEGENILLVKPVYLDTWCLPGGGVKKFETFYTAANRELLEETGFKANSLSLFGIYMNSREGKFDNIVVFLCEDFLEGTANSFEIDEVKWFYIDNLPENLYPGVFDRIDEYMLGKFPTTGKW